MRPGDHQVRKQRTPCVQDLLVVLVPQPLHKKRRVHSGVLGSFVCIGSSHAQLLSSLEQMHWMNFSTANTNNSPTKVSRTSAPPKNSTKPTSVMARPQFCRPLFYQACPATSALLSLLALVLVVPVPAHRRALDRTRR